MKIRNGFVSNSSSSSFVIYGAWVDSEDIKSQLTDEALKEIEKESYMISEWAYDIPMFVHYDGDNQRGAFGRSYSGIKDDETGKQFKEDVEKKLEEAFGKKIKCDAISHEYYC